MVGWTHSYFEINDSMILLVANSSKALEVASYSLVL